MGGSMSTQARALARLSFEMLAGRSAGPCIATSIHAYAPAQVRISGRVRQMQSLALVKQTRETGRIARWFRASRSRMMMSSAVGAIALTIATSIVWSLLPEDRARSSATTYVPEDAERVITHVSPRDPDEVRARRALATSPDRLEIAVELARADLQRYRRASDPRYLGRAQATLAHWWRLTEPPPDVLLLRATIRQSLHDFAGARADLDRLVSLTPGHPQAHLTRAVVATVTADYQAARESCAVISRVATQLVFATCIAPLDAIAGDAAGAYQRLASSLTSSRAPDRNVRSWALTELAELASMLGNTRSAERHLREALASDPDDAYARDALADVLLATGRTSETSALLAGREAIDGHLLRRAIAEVRLGGSGASELVAMMRERIRAAAVRADRVHLREEARFALTVENDPSRAVALASANWTVQKELADARLLAEAALRAGDASAAEPVHSWARSAGVRDVQLDAWLDRLGGAR